ncbi:hypothetical protein Hypma_015119 [Hypsizygus marmoreus]|uniref:von Willebrand factor A domain-containing protein 5A n=1 Tax=Hypsizygus marmoreus TaxID=39966 RepID=A0A369KFA7_HYPMA|nr:hypothetical protein Hypma_015119 [Hypsizygus marmoreus]
MSYSGVTYNSVSSDGSTRTAYLSLEEVRVKVLVIDLSARVTLAQKFFNASDITTGRCKYLFPVPASAAICAFDIQTSDGRTIVGVAKEKDVAQVQYEEALSAGKFAGLANYVTDDIFTISIGAVPALATVETNIVFVMSLANYDNADEVRFQLSRGVGDRYGSPPPELASALVPRSHTKIKITAEIQMSGKIQEIVSPSHSNDISETIYPTHVGRPSHRRSTVKFRSRSFLDRDFVLIIRSDGLDSPRCFAEILADPDRRSFTIGMQATIIPKFSLPPIAAQEYLFVIDHSGSMHTDARMDQAKRTLMLLLRLLPSRGTKFNIFVFDDSFSSLWPQSRLYDQGSLNDATTYIGAIVPEGGTEIGPALEAALRSRSTNIPTATFVLTDGEVYNYETAVSIVESSVKNAMPHAPSRLFTLGIGNGISTAACEGLARAGNGTSFFATDAESILGKCARLLGAGRTPFVKNVTVDWGVPPEYLTTPSVAFPEEASSTTVVRIRPPATIQQVPTQIHDMHAGTRTNILAIITLRRTYAPQEIRLRGEFDNGGGDFELIIPVRGVQLADSESGLPLIHTLAAWRLIQEHEEKKAPLPAALIPSREEDIRKAVIVRLGERYQLISRHTSFVAEDSGQNDWRRSSDRRRGSPVPQGGQTWDTNRSIDDDIPRGFRSTVSEFLSGLFGYPGGSHISSVDQQVLPGSWVDHSPQPSSPPSANGTDDEDGYESDNTFTTLSSLESYAWSEWSPPSSPYIRSESLEEPGSSPKLEPLSLAPETERQRRVVPRDALPGRPPPRPPAPSEVVALVHLQCFDGSFALNDSLHFIVGRQAVDEAYNLRVEDKVWATAISIAFMRKRMGQHTELLKDLLVKAMEFLDLNAGVDVKELIRRAEGFIA